MSDLKTETTGTITPITGNSTGVKASYKEVPDANKAKTITLAQVNAAQDKLLTAIEKIEGNAKDILKNRVRHDENVIKAASIGGLDDDKESITLDDHAAKDEKGNSIASTGLNDHQTKTEAFFKKTMADKVSKEVLEALAELNALRSQLFAQERNKEINKIIQDSKDALDAYLQGGLFKLRGAAGGATGPDGNPRTLAQELGSQEPGHSHRDNTVYSPDKKTWVRVGETEQLDQQGTPTGKKTGSIESNDPIALGIAIASNGWDPATINSEDIDFALKAAASAIQQGVKNVKLHPTIWAKLKPENAEQFFNSYHEQNEFKRRAQAITRLSNSPNSIFSDTKQNTFTDRFLNTADVTLKREMVNVLTPKQQAELAWDLKLRAVFPVDEGGNPQDPLKFIQNAVVIKHKSASGFWNKVFNNYRYVPNWEQTREARRAFFKELHKVYADKAMEDIGKKEDPKEIAKDMRTSAKNAAANNGLDLNAGRISRNMVRKIKDTPNKHLHNEIRAAYMSELFDEHLKKSKDEKTQVLNEKTFAKELKAIFKGLNDKDKMEVHRIFEKKYDRTHVTKEVENGVEKETSPNDKEKYLSDPKNRDVYDRMNEATLKYLPEINVSHELDTDEEEHKEPEKHIRVGATAPFAPVESKNEEENLTFESRGPKP